MRAATPQGFAAVIEARAATPRSHATAEEGAGRGESLQSIGDPAKDGDGGEGLRLGGGQFR
jgi:hypothetical protein